MFLTLSSNSTDSLIFVFLVVAIIIVFLAIRELICWYYKINKQVSNQQEILKILALVQRDLQQTNEYLASLQASMNTKKDVTGTETPDSADTPSKHTKDEE